LNEKVYFEQQISETAHLPNVLRFYVRMWRQSHLYGTLR